ncbi:MAG: hypothetical protein H6807_12095 [Planctomycetes bacterium]|nr:hypothetical protein [Planctomycetota bacterium]
MSVDDLEFSAERRLILWHPRGVLDAARIRDYFEAMGACPWGATADRYCDFSAVENFILDFHQMLGLVRFRVRHLADHRRVRLGIFAPQDIAFAFSRMYEMLMENEGVDILVARDDDKVRRFLGMDSITGEPLDS